MEGIDGILDGADVAARLDIDDLLNLIRRSGSATDEEEDAVVDEGDEVSPAVDRLPADA